jgi:uncharacterized spore protein YtfJ
MSDNNFDSTVESLFKGMDSFLTTKTVVGDAVKFDDGTIILPLVEVCFGVGAGAFAGDKKNNAGGGMGGRITPSSVLVIQNGSSKLVNVKAQDSVTKILDMVPDIINKFSKDKKKKNETDDMDDKVAQALKNQADSDCHE